MKNPGSVARHFRISGEPESFSRYGSGHINDTFLIVTKQGAARTRYIIQRINHSIFRDPVRLMENIKMVTEHQQWKLRGHDDASRRSLALLPCVDGRSHYRDDSGEYWRCYPFIERTSTFDIAGNPEQVFQAAKAFGQFQQDLADFPATKLHETIPDFHNTPKRFRDFLYALETDPCNRAATVREEVDLALEREPMTHCLWDLQVRGVIPQRITHNDTKLNNVLLDDKTGEGVCVIDLDTVMPGLSLYDFGDLVRSCTNPAAEDERDLSRVNMQMRMYEALVRGYLSSAGETLNETEKAHLAVSGKLITFETGLRFLTDYLQGDTYFKVHREGHNLDRCRTQFKLVGSIEDQEDAMQMVVKKGV